MHVENADVISFPGIPSGRGGCRCALGEFLEFRLAGEEEGLVPFGAGVSVEKFLAETLNGARVGVQIAHVINIYLARDKFGHVKTLRL